ncbi:MAG: homoprotocatechuate degradation operon regulator HpaR [Pseudomonadota bacterium]
MSKNNILLKFDRGNLPLLMLQAREGLIARFRPVLQSAGLTEQQWRVLRVLSESGTQEPKDLVKLCRISSSSIAGVLARMEEVGLVKKVRLAHDQRRVHVSASNPGLKVALKLAPDVNRIYAEVEEALGKDFTEQLYQALAHVIDTCPSDVQ